MLRVQYCQSYSIRYVVTHSNRDTQSRWSNSNIHCSLQVINCQTEMYVLQDDCTFSTYLHLHLAITSHGFYEMPTNESTITDFKLSPAI